MCGLVDINSSSPVTNSTWLSVGRDAWLLCLMAIFITFMSGTWLSSPMGLKIVLNNQNIVYNTKLEIFRFKLKDYFAARIGELLWGLE